MIITLGIIVRAMTGAVHHSSIVVTALGYGIVDLLANNARVL
jgi:hypothetical protein